MDLNKKKSFSLLIRIFLLLALTVCISPVAQADTLWDVVKDKGIEDVGHTAWDISGTPTDVGDYVVLVIRAFLGLLGIIFVVLIIHAGYKWMTAAGSEEPIREAKSEIRAAIIGLIIIMLSYSITVLVQREILDKI